MSLVLFLYSNNTSTVNRTHVVQLQYDNELMMVRKEFNLDIKINRRNHDFEL